MNGNCGPATEGKVSCERGSMVHGPSSKPVLTFFYLFFFSFFNLKLPITLFSYFVIQFKIKTFEKKKI